MTQQSRADRVSPEPSIWHKTPAAFKVGTIVAILGFFVTITASSSTTVNGKVTSCSYYDFGAFVAALILVVCAFSGIAATRNVHQRLRLNHNLLYGGAGILITLAIIHVVRGFGVIGGTC